VSNPEQTNNVCIIVVADLFAKINAQRKLLRRPPVEERAMASRCTLRFNIDRPRQVDFSAEKIVLTSDDMVLLEKVVNDQFGLQFDGELRKLCLKVERPAAEPASPESPLEEVAEAPSQAEEGGLMAKIKRLFGGK
jgi:hypothetical protein